MFEHVHVCTQTRLHEATMAAKAAASLTVQLGERDKRITQLADQGWQ